MASLTASLQQINALADNKAKLDRYQTLINSLFAAQNVGDSKALLRHILSPETPLVLTRQALHLFAFSLDKLNNASMIEVGGQALELITPRVTSFEEEDAKIREQLAEAFAAKRDFYSAAKTLAVINLEGSSRSISPEEKAETYVKIAEFFVEADDNVSAESYNSKASMIMHLVKSVSLQLRHKACHARLLDAKREFLQAARAYYALSQEGHQGVDESDLMQLLQNAVVCTILAKAGPQRSRLLATLYKDERTANLPTFEILEKMFMDRILRKPEVRKFGDTIQDHQKALLSSGFTVLDKAIIEHNMVAVSKIYNNITFEELGALLEITPLQAEKIVATMVSEGRLQASLDELASVVEFENESESLVSWDANIAKFCQDLDRLLADIAVSL